MQWLAQFLIGNALIALVLALLATLAMRWRRPALGHALWLMVIVKLITPPLVHLPVSLPEMAKRIEQNLSPSPGNPGEGRGEGSDLIPAAVAENPHPNPLPAYRERESVEPTPVTATQFLFDITAFIPSILTLILSLWLIGSTLWLAIVLLRISRFSRLIDPNREIPQDLQTRVDQLIARIGLRRAPQICLIPANVSPMLWYIGGEPKLLLPSQLLSELSHEQRDALLLHELAHLKRGDHLCRMLELLATGIFWWHPLLWWARRGLHESEEQCCDAWVMQTMPQSARSYADALVNTLDFLAASPRNMAPCASGVGGLHNLQRRLAMIFTNTPQPTMSVAGKLAVLVLFCAMPLAPVWSQPATRPTSQPSALPDTKISAAKTDIAVFQTALGAYEIDTGRYPSSTEGLAALMQRIGNVQNWHGPYLSKLPLDPWGTSYRYAMPGRRSVRGFDLWSAGPDGRDATPDDIGDLAPAPTAGEPSNQVLAQALFEATGDTDRNVQVKATNSLIAMKDDALEVLLMAAASNDGQIRQRALRLLGELMGSIGLQNPAFSPEDGALFGGMPGGYHLTPRSSQAKEWETKVAPVALKAASDPRLEIRGMGLMLLGQLPDQVDTTLPAITKLLEDEHPGIRSSALTTMSGLVGVHGKEKISIIMPALIKCLGDNQASMRHRAIDLMARFGPAARGAMPELLKALKDPDPAVRSAAASAIGQLQFQPPPVPVPGLPMDEALDMPGFPEPGLEGAMPPVSIEERMRQRRAQDNQRKTNQPVPRTPGN